MLMNKVLIGSPTHTYTQKRHKLPTSVLYNLYEHPIYIHLLLTYKVHEPKVGIDCKVIQIF
jgi:hypothetical protein